MTMIPAKLARTLRNQILDVPINRFACRGAGLIPEVLREFEQTLRLSIRIAMRSPHVRALPNPAVFDLVYPPARDVTVTRFLRAIPHLSEGLVGGIIDDAVAHHDA
jgi:hypothetical protein